MCACVASVSFWLVNHLKVIVQQRSQVLFSCFWSEWAMYWHFCCRLSTCGDGWFCLLGFSLVLEIQNQFAGGVSRVGNIYLLENLDLVVDWRHGDFELAQFLRFSGVQIFFCLLLDVAVPIGMGDFRGTSLKWWVLVSLDIVAQSQVFELVQWISIYLCWTFISFNSLLL